MILCYCFIHLHKKFYFSLGTVTVPSSQYRPFQLASADKICKREMRTSGSKSDVAKERCSSFQAIYPSLLQNLFPLNVLFICFYDLLYSFYHHAVYSLLSYIILYTVLKNLNNNSSPFRPVLKFK